MNFNFELILFYATLVAGLICLFDIIFLARRRKRKSVSVKAKKKADGSPRLPIIIDYAYSFFPVLLIVFLLRSFLYEPFRIPSGSLEPTLNKGDFILVNKYDYGVRLPVIHKLIMKNNSPQRGDIIVFRWPPNPSFDFIKRVIGLPGDHIKYVNKEIFINGTKITQELLRKDVAIDELGDKWQAQVNKENLMGINHQIYIDPQKPGYDFKEFVVPDGMYFVMGDNRDNSADSRYWGFVPDKNIVGKAVRVWMSWNNNDRRVRWDRIGMAIQ